MKKIIALMLVLLLMLTMFVACKKDKEEGTANENTTTTETGGGDENPEGEMAWDDVGKAEKPNQNDGTGLKLPIVPFLQ